MLTPLLCSVTVSLASVILISPFLADRLTSFASAWTPFRSIFPSVASNCNFPPDLIFVVFSLVVFELLEFHPIFPVTDVVFPAKSPKITLVTLPATWAAANASFTAPSFAESAICIPLFTASAIELVVLFFTVTPISSPELFFSTTSSYLVVSILLALIVKSPPVSKSDPPISVFPPDVIFKFPPVFTLPSVHVVLFSLEFFIDTPIWTDASVNASM